MTDFPACPFWDAAVAFYDAPGVAEACLALQDRRSQDVNLLLLACWLGGRGVLLDDRRATLVRAAGGRWQGAVVAPLREARRALRAQIEHARPGEVGARFPGLATRLRRRLATLELDLEHLQQLALFETVQAWRADASPGPQTAAANLAALGRFAADDRTDLETLLTAAFADAPAAEIDAALSLALAGA